MNEQISLFDNDIPQPGSLTPQIPERRLQPYFFGQIQIPYFS